jgi:putative FmdB family regulatory protein
MPTYEFRCPDGHVFDRFYRKISDGQSEVACPQCGKIATRQMSAGAGLLFKGSGFYLTDYGKNAHRGSKSDGGDPSKSSEGGSSESKGDSKPSETKASESKSGESKSNESKSGESRSSESRSSESKRSESSSSDSKSSSTASTPSNSTGSSGPKSDK